MNNTQVIWLAATIIGVVVAVLLAFAALRRRRVRYNPVTRTAWLVAATMSGTMLIFC